MNNVRLKQRWVSTLIVLLASVAISFADEIVPIGTILANASSFADHLVTFRGLVVSLDRIAGPSLPLARGSACVRHHRYMAIIEDETGSIHAIVCGSPLDEKGSVAKGDRVVLRANINVISGVGFKSDVLAVGVLMERAIEVNQ
jgi:hypothetical protein